jgi:hypothetical protein
MLKKQLDNFTSGFKKVVDDINLLLTNQIHNHALTMIAAQLRFSIELRQSVFQKLTAHVTLYALRLIASQYHLLIERSTVLILCIKIFSTTTELSCSHKIQKRLYRNEMLMLKNVHVH